MRDKRSLDGLALVGPLAMRPPVDVQRLEVPARQYAVFEHRGHVSSIYESYFQIWNVAMPSIGRAVADAPVIERHYAAFDPDTGEGGLSLWIPLV